MEISIKKFEELTALELYKILELRTEIFVVEQECAYLETDGHDQKCVHILGFENEKLAAYARIVPPNTIYKEPSIGRVAVAQAFRLQGLGGQVFQAALLKAKELFSNRNIRIQAQTYLEKWYKSFGFETVSEPYPDVGIMHVDMIY